MGNYLVIGASSGIGKNIAEKLIALGHKVYATYNTGKIELSNCETCHFDASDDNSLPTFEIDVLDGLVYCPGTINLKPFRAISREDFTRDYKINVLGAVALIQKYLNALKKSPGASIVLFSTIAVQMGFNFHSQISSSKGAIEGLTRALAAEFAPKIRVNAIAPSLTDTPLAEKLLNSEQKREANANSNPMKVVGNASNISDMAIFLLSEKASWISGQIMHVDGGLSRIKL